MFWLDANESLHEFFGCWECVFARQLNYQTCLYIDASYLFLDAFPAVMLAAYFDYAPYVTTEITTQYLAQIG